MMLVTLRECRRPMVRPHDLRHMAISLWVDQGASQKKVQPAIPASPLHSTVMATSGLIAPETGQSATGRSAAFFIPTTGKPEPQRVLAAMRQPMSDFCGAFVCVWHYLLRNAPTWIT